MSIEDDQRTRALENLMRATPDVFRREVAYLLTGALPGDTRPRDGGRSSLMAMPGWDTYDRTLRQSRKRYIALLQLIDKSAEELSRIQSSVMEVAKEVKQDPKCTNAPDCENVVTDCSQGECGRCRTWRSRHGRGWTSFDARKARSRGMTEVGP